MYQDIDIADLFKASALRTISSFPDFTKP